MNPFQLVRNDVVVASLKVTGTQTKKIMGENVVDLQVSTPGYIDILMGTKITVHGEDYILNKLPDLKKVSNLQYDYSLHFESVSYELINFLYLFYDPNNQPTEAQFSLMGNAETFIDLLIINANRAGSGWTKGIVDDTDFKNLSFSDENCLQVLNRLAQEFETEFYITGKTINFTKKGVNTGLTFEYGKNKGLYNIGRTTVDSKSIVTRLYVYGSEKNIPGDYRGSTFNKKLKMPVAIGNYIDKNIDKYGIIEAVKVFDNIYPRYTGTVSAVGDEFTFTDAGIDFNVNNCKLPGTDRPPKIVFNTGLLAGYEFSVHSYNDVTKTFVINLNDDEKAMVVPSPTLKAAIGDKYVIINIIMPQTYIDQAETDLHTEALQYLDQNADPHVQYTVQPDPLYFKRNLVDIGLGDYITIVDTAIGINKNIRTIGFTRDINPENPYLYTSLDLADSVSVASIVRQFNKTLDIQKAVNINKLSDVNRARQSWKTQKEVLDMMFDPTTGLVRTDKMDVGYLNSLIIDSKVASQNFALQVQFSPNDQSNVNRLAWSAGQLAHREFITYQNGIWTFAAGFVTGLDPAKAYYIYLDSPHNSAIATVVISDQMFAYDFEAGKYRFLLGILSSVIDGYRTVTNTFGSTRINLGQISSGVLANQSGQTVLNLDERKFYGTFTFSNGDDVSTVIATAQTAANNANNAASAAQTTANNASTAAGAAQTAANNAATAASNAQSSADSANNVLTNIASDNVLTPNEKQLTKKEFDAINAEYTTIVNQAGTYGISTANYGTAYTALSNYVSPLLVDLTTNSAIVGADFRSTFATYYDERTKLLKAISDAAKDLADAAQTTANNAQTAVNNLANSLGNMAFEDAVELSKLGTTVIQGGYLKTELIDVSLLVARTIKTADAGKRVEVKSSDNTLKFYDVDNNIVVDIDDDSTIVGYNLAGDPVYGAGVKVGNTSIATTGLHLTGGAKIYGLTLSITTLFTTSDYYLKLSNTVISVRTNSGSVNVFLPDYTIAPVGKVYNIMKNAGANVVIKLSNGTTIVTLTGTRGVTFANDEYGWVIMDQI